MFVLIMIISGYSTSSGVAIVQQEFTSKEKCEAARLEIAKMRLAMISQGCYAK